MGFRSTSRNRIAVQAALDQALARSETDAIGLPPRVLGFIEMFSVKIPSATTAFTNLVTGLACAIAEPTVDPRYHRPDKPDEMPKPPQGKSWYAGRGISEKAVYPWLKRHGFRTARSGWQTRVFERPRPYTLDYPENIGFIKDEFLAILRHVAEGGVDPEHVLAYFLKLEQESAERRALLVGAVAGATPGFGWTIEEMIGALSAHFAAPRSSRLPVLAIQAIYATLIDQIGRFSGKRLLVLEEHSAADVHTGSVGDVVVVNEDESVFEAVEVKHHIDIDETIILAAHDKVATKPVERYYILTTGDPYRPLSPYALELVTQLRADYGCQMIINGVLPTIRYYLRLLPDPTAFIDEYEKLLVDDPQMTEDLMQAWLDTFEGI